MKGRKSGQPFSVPVAHFERDDAFAQILSENPGCGQYEERLGRAMPVALLTPR